MNISGCCMNMGLSLMKSTYYDLVQPHSGLSASLEA
jgi:hypothetical protein